MIQFEKLGLDKKILDILEELKFSEPTEIQWKTIPLILKGKDIIGKAATGSGKTFAFVSGLIQNIEKGKGIQSLVLAPTRELVDQIAKVTKTFAKKTNLQVEEIYGGVGIEPQIRKAKQADIVIGTPGRILDLLERKAINFSQIKVLVLDEADRMVDMGFLPDVKRIISACSEKRQTLLFSATTSPDVNYMAKHYMRDPTYISAEDYVDPTKLKQTFYDTPPHLKFSLLVHFLKKEKKGIIMVFCATRKNVDLITENLQRNKIHAHSIHGGLDQKKRSRIIEQLHKNKADILVCTDVAARGLDIKNVTHVYNYDSPKTSEDYIHRIGRTARAGKDGEAITIVTNRDYENFQRVLLDDNLNIEQKPLPEIEKVSARFQKPQDRRFQDRGRNYSRERNDKPRRDTPRGTYKKRNTSGRNPRYNNSRSGAPRRDNQRSHPSRRDSRGGSYPRKGPRDNHRKDSRAHSKGRFTKRK